MTSFRRFRGLALRGAEGALALGMGIMLTLLAGQKAEAQTYHLVFEFLANGATPTAGVTIRGNSLWGTTSSGGIGGGGTVYELVSTENIWSLVNISDHSDSPKARVNFGPDGHPYIATSGYGTFGFVFDFFPPATICKTANCSWKANTLHNFTDGSSDGANPGYGDLAWDQQGNMYGTTTLAGGGGVGTVYELMPPIPPSKMWTEEVIWNFSGHDGKYPQNAVIFDSNGNLLGTAKQGGANGFGTVFRLTPSGNTWIETNVYEFQGGSDGQYPIAGLWIDGSGNIYGATSDGGSGGGGTVFELTPSGSTYTFRLLYSFSGQQGNNCGPWATLTMDASGNLFGTTYCDGLNNLGSIFKLSSTQNGWTYVSLHDFAGFTQGAHPISNVSIDAHGTLYGTASMGGTGAGVVWKVTP